VSGTNAIVLDSNAVIGLLNDEANSLALEERFPDAAVCISVITQIEVLGFPNITPDEEKQIVGFYRILLSSILTMRLLPGRL
jgi:predicted nucleic acid-binding protein